MSEPELTVVPRDLYYVERRLVQRQADEIAACRARGAELEAALQSLIEATDDGISPHPWGSEGARQWEKRNESANERARAVLAKGTQP